MIQEARLNNLPNKSEINSSVVLNSFIHVEFFNIYLAKRNADKYICEHTNKLNFIAMLGSGKDEPPWAGLP